MPFMTYTWAREKTTNPGEQIVSKDIWGYIVIVTLKKQVSFMPPNI